MINRLKKPSILEFLFCLAQTQSSQKTLLTLILGTTTSIAVPIWGSVFLDEKKYRFLSGSKELEIFFKAVILLTIADAVAKLFFTNFSGLQIKHFSLLPIKKRTLSVLIQLKFLFTAPNIIYIPLLLFASIVIVYPAFGYTIAALFFLNTFTLFLTISLLVSIIKETFWTKISGIITISLAIISLGILIEYLFSNQTDLSHTIIAFLAPSAIIIFPSFFALLWWNHKIIINNFYMVYDESLHKSFSQTNLFKRLWGHKLLNLLLDEFYLIVRNKRTKQFFIANITLSFFFLIFYHQINDNNNSIEYTLIYLIVVTSYPITCYLQMSFGWQSKYFEGLLTKSLYNREVMETKIMLFNIYCIWVFIISSPIFVLNSKLFILFLTATLCNIGLNSYILVLFTFFNYKPINLSRSTIMNYEGISSFQFISTLLFISVPVFIYEMYSMVFKNEVLSLVSLCLTCISSGLAMHKHYLRLISNFFHKRKYKILQGFK